MILLTEIIDITCKKISQHLHVRDDLEIMLINNKRYLLRFDSGFDHTTEQPTTNAPFIYNFYKIKCIF